jgi:hypothetical protein
MLPPRRAFREDGELPGAIFFQQEIKMKTLQNKGPASEATSKPVHLTLRIWALTLAILFGGAILAESLHVPGDAIEATAQRGVVVAGRAASDPAPATAADREPARSSTTPRN